MAQAGTTAHCDRDFRYPANPIAANPVPVPKHVEHAEPKPLERAVRRGGCQNFQSYDPGSGTYTGYDLARRLNGLNPPT
jgi:hypothetical protein